jgi:hypothetical protein
LRDGKVFLAGRPQADAEKAAAVAARPKRTEPIETQDDAEKTNVQR